MEHDQYLQEVQKRLTEKRYIHTLGVRDTAIHLAEKYGADKEKAEVAAILHDIAKYEDVDAMRAIVRERKLDERLLPWENEILHGPVGAEIVKDLFHIEDEDILNAIRYHTTGRVNMTKLEKVIYVADMIEPNRKFVGVDRLRQIAEEDLEEAIKECITHTLTFLVASRQLIYPLTIECYNDLMRKE